MADNYAKSRNLLYEFSIIVEREKDLHRLYFISLPIIMIAFGFERGVIFKYSKRKRCFDPKAGLKKENLKELHKKWESSSNAGEFAEYMLKIDTSSLYETEFNKKIRGLNIPCNDTSRSIANMFVTKTDRHLKAEEIENKYIARILKDMEMDISLYIPLIAKSSTVGFLLLSPPDKKTDDLKLFCTGLGLAMSSLIEEKEVANLKHFLDFNEDDIKHKQRLYEIGKTASTITHEIKNALIGIMGLFDKLKKYVESTEKTDRYVEIIESELNRIYRFVADINKFSKHYTPTDKKPLNLKDVIDKAIDLTSTINNNFVFSVCIDKKASTVFGDRNQLEQVLINLFKNSIEAYGNREGGQIRIRAKRDGEFIILKIRDNSGGVEDKQLKEITKPFYTTKTQGTGLGLSIVKEIVKEHGGDIEFKNTKDGLECTIKLSAPKNITEGEYEQKEDYDS